MENISPFIFTVLTILGMPGPINTLLATSGAATGWRASLKLVPAEVCGYLTTILLLGFVVGPVIAGEIAGAGGKAGWVPRIGAVVVTVFAMVVVVSPLMK